MTRNIPAMSAVVFAISASGSASAAVDPASQARMGVQATLDASAAAWNQADLDRFMTCYEQAPTTTYVNATRTVHGYEAIRAMYAGRFDGGSSAVMGQLALEIVDFRMVGDMYAYVIGQYHLHRDAAHGGDATGPTTLLFKRTAPGWRIVADHS